MNLTSDLLNIGLRIDDRSFNEPRKYKITEIDGQLTIQSENLTMLFSLQKITTTPSFDKPKKGFLKIFGCDQRVQEVYKKCIQFEKLCIKEYLAVEKVLIKIRIVEGFSFELIFKGINRLLEVHSIPFVYLPEVKVYSINKYIIRDPGKEETDGVFVVAKVKEVVLYAEMYGANVGKNVILKCLRDDFEKSDKKIKLG